MDYFTLIEELQKKINRLVISVEYNQSQIETVKKFLNDMGRPAPKPQKKASIVVLKGGKS